MCHKATPAPYHRRRLPRQSSHPSPRGSGGSPPQRERNEAYALLSSGLDAEQRRTQDRLVAAGVLPDEGPCRAAAH
ncbi:DUF6400 family protein [Streptomyces parvus]|uniref:DUF6400 family protein n=1 Tax=Streptomyces parvus TaxID=66428 RepID=UPI003643B49B